MKHKGTSRYSKGRSAGKLDGITEERRRAVGIILRRIRGVCDAATSQVINMDVVRQLNECAIMIGNF